MTGPKVCVSLDGTTVKAMADEAARANLAGAEFVEVRFDRLYLKKPEPVEVEDEDGEIKRIMERLSVFPHGTPVSLLDRLEGGAEQLASLQAAGLARVTRGEVSFLGADASREVETGDVPRVREWLATESGDPVGTDDEIAVLPPVSGGAE